MANSVYYLDPVEIEMERIIEEYGNSLLRLCFLYLKDIHLAEDALQDSFTKIYKSSAKFNGDSHEKTWITRIVINTCKNYLRSNWWKRIDESTVLEQIGAIEEKDTTDDTVITEIMKLKQKYREVVLLFYYQELKIKEIADVLAISESAVAVRLNRAREILKNKLKGWYYDA